MSKLYELKDQDLCTIPNDCVAKIIKKGKKMGTFGFFYYRAVKTAVFRTKDAFKTLGYLMGSVSTENIVYVDVPAVAREMKNSNLTTQRHLKTLVDQGIIIPHEATRPEAKSINNYRICPWIVWKGAGKEMEAYITTLPLNHPFWDYADPEFKEALAYEIELKELKPYKPLPTTLETFLKEPKPKPSSEEIKKNFQKIKDKELNKRNNLNTQP